MAKVKLNPIFAAIQGELNGYIFRSTPDGQIIVSSRPDMSNVQWTDAQTAHRQRFKEATAYAKAALADPQVRVQYEEQAAALKKSPYSLAVSDYFKDINLLEK